MEGSDDISGIDEGCCAGVWLNTDMESGFLNSSSTFLDYVGVNGRVQSIDGNRYQVFNFPTNGSARTALESSYVVRFSVYDKAGNQQTLHRENEFDSYYTDSDGNLTDIPVIKLGGTNAHQGWNVELPELPKLKCGNAPGALCESNCNSFNDALEEQQNTCMLASSEDNACLNATDNANYHQDRFVACINKNY